jgi:hypothetical protein
MYLVPNASADGHGPVFGLATPTNSQGEWSFDTGVFGRANDSGSEASFRELIGYGFTPHVTLFVGAPVVSGSLQLTPTRIQPDTDFDATLKWRFQHRATKVGTRIESTLFAGLAAPGPQSGFRNIVTTNAPGTIVGAVTGMASRSHYLWLGATFTKFYEHAGSKRPDVFDYSLVYGYRPPKWRRPPDKLDWRFFAELVGEHFDSFVQAGVSVLDVQDFRCADCSQLREYVLHRATPRETGLFSRKSRCVRSRFAVQRGNPVDLRDHLWGGILRCFSFGPNPHAIRPVLEHPETTPVLRSSWRAKEWSGIRPAGLTSASRCGR